MLGQSEDGTSLPELVARTREVFAAGAQAASDQLSALLLEAGYSDIHAAKYEGRRLKVVGTRYFRVADGFPCLTPATVMPGVTEASYSVDIAQCLSFELSEAAALDLVSAEGAA